MFDLFIMLSRYLFIFYIGLYLWLGIVYIAYEQGGNLGNPYKAIDWQRKIILYFHLTGFFILSYNENTNFIRIETVFFAITSYIFIKVMTKALDKYYYDGCPLIWTGMIFLVDISLMMLHRLEPLLATKQLLWCTIGLVGVLLLPVFFRFVPRFEAFEWAYIVLSYALLICTQFFGTEGGGSTNWLSINLLGRYFTFQPSEIVKFLFIFYLASVFRKRLGLKSLIMVCGLGAGIVLLLVMQKDLGSALIFFMTFMVMLYTSTANESLFFLGMFAVGGASTVAYKFFYHVRVRVSAWQNPWADIDGGGYQIVNALFAITTYGLLGSGLTKGMPYIIPVVESDMIFAAICEEFGALFGIAVICIFIMFLYRGVRIALDCERLYYSFLAMGVTTMICFQAFIIIGGVIKFIPLTGVTLPFVSYGGSSVLVSFMMVGLLQWICVYCEEHGYHEPKDGSTRRKVDRRAYVEDDQNDDEYDEYDEYDDEYDYIESSTKTKAKTKTKTNKKKYSKKNNSSNNNNNDDDDNIGYNNNCSYQNNDYNNNYNNNYDNNHDDEYQNGYSNNNYNENGNNYYDDDYQDDYDDNDYEYQDDYNDFDNNYDNNYYNENYQNEYNDDYEDDYQYNDNDNNNKNYNNNYSNQKNYNHRRNNRGR